jgi:hypothetical protein
VTSPIWGCASSNLDEVVHLKIYQIECSRFEKYSDPKVQQAQKLYSFKVHIPTV